MYWKSNWGEISFISNFWLEILYFTTVPMAGIISQKYKYKKELICLIVIGFISTPLSDQSHFWKGSVPAPWAELIKGDNSAICNPKEFSWTGKQYNTWPDKRSDFNETFLIRHFYNSTCPLFSTCSQAVKWDSRTFLSWILQQNYLWAGHSIILRWI